MVEAPFNWELYKFYILFLGNTITASGIEPNLAKMEVISICPPNSWWSSELSWHYCLCTQIHCRLRQTYCHPCQDPWFQYPLILDPLKGFILSYPQYHPHLVPFLPLVNRKSQHKLETDALYHVIEGVLLVDIGVGVFLPFSNESWKLNTINQLYLF